MKASVQLVDGVMFVAEADSGHAIVLDGPADGGGRNAGVRPMELVLLGTGGCTAYDVVTILRKARQDVTGCRLELEAERAAEAPKVFTKIHIKYIITGRNISPEQVKKAIALSAEKYCSASVMLAKTAAISHDFVIEEPA